MFLEPLMSTQVDALSVTRKDLRKVESFINGYWPFNEHLHRIGIHIHGNPPLLEVCGGRKRLGIYFLTALCLPLSLGWIERTQVFPINKSIPPWVQFVNSYCGRRKHSLFVTIYSTNSFDKMYKLVINKI